MNKLMKYVISLILIFSVSTSLCSPLEKCLSNTHVSTTDCAQQNIKLLTLSSCFAEAEKIKSDLSKENLTQFCFYNVSEFPTLKSCLSRSKNFKTAINHDESLFECIRQFQNEISQIQCLSIAEKMRYPEKLEHLKRNCDQL